MFKRILPVLAGLFLLSSAHTSLQAENKWYYTKAEAFEAAKAEGKYVFLIGERPTCGNCQAVLGFIEEKAVQEIITESYILWRFDWDSNKTNPESDAKDYIAEILANTTFKVLPALFIINPEIPEKCLTYAYGYHNVEKLTAFFDIEGRPVSNEEVPLAANNIFIDGNTLTISNATPDETITVYTIGGQKVATAVKKGTQMTINAGAYPKGVLIVSSSAGWSGKVLNK